METITKTIYVANDGEEFDTIEQCQRYETRHLRMSPEKLTNEQIVSLLEIIHESQLCHQDIVTKSVKIEVTTTVITSAGFEYRISVVAKPKGFCNTYSAVIEGCGDAFAIYHHDGQKRLKNEALEERGYPLKKVHDYLDSIGYWEQKDHIPANPDITPEWKLIHTRLIEAY